MNGEGVVPVGTVTDVSGPVAKLKAYQNFCLAGLPSGARDMNRVTCLLSGESAAGGWRKGSLS